MEASKHYSQASYREMQRREQVATEIEAINEARAWLMNLSGFCDSRGLYVDNHIEQISLALDDEAERVSEVA